MKALHVVALSSLALAVAPALAQGPSTQGAARDMRCMLITTHFSKAVKDPKLGPLMTLASSFYLGRVDRGVTPADLDRSMRAEARSLVGTNPAAEARDCVAYMSSRAQVVQRIGRSLAQSAPTPDTTR